MRELVQGRNNGRPRARPLTTTTAAAVVVFTMTTMPACCIALRATFPLNKRSTNARQKPPSRCRLVFASTKREKYELCGAATGSAARGTFFSPALRYRAHDDGDSESVKVRLLSRVPLFQDHIYDRVGGSSEWEDEAGETLIEDIRDAARDRRSETPLREKEVSEPATPFVNWPIMFAMVMSQLLLICLSTLVSAAVIYFVARTGGEFGHDLPSLFASYGWAPAPDAVGIGNDLFGFLASISGGVGGDPSVLQRLAMGVLASAPMLAYNDRVERSDERGWCSVNFSTAMMAMTLFGRRRHEPTNFEEIFVDAVAAATAVGEKEGDEVTSRSRVRQRQHLEPTGGHLHYRPNLLPPPTTPSTTRSVALGVTLATSTLVGLCEETTFRLQIPSAVWHLTHHNTPLALLCQAAVFGALHVHPRADASYNRLVPTTHFLSGLWYGLVYLMSGGDVVPCIIAHALYDFVTIYGTWTATNNQMDYASAMYDLVKLPRDQEGEVERIREGVGREHLPESTCDDLERLFYTFDYDRRGSLSKSDARRAATYAFLKDELKPTEESVDNVFDSCLRRRKEAEEKGAVQVTEELKNRLRFPDFLRMFLVLRSSSPSTSSAPQYDGGDSSTGEHEGEHEPAL